MNNWARLGISGLVSAALALLGYLLPYTPLIYFFAPGFWLTDPLSDATVNALGGYLLPVFVSTIIWAILIFAAWLLLAKVRKRN